jgi:hypothetical protein
MKKGVVFVVAIVTMCCSTSSIQNNSLKPAETRTGTSGSTSLNDSLSNGLVAWYPLNGNANDASGHGFNGVVHGATLVADRFGNPNSAYSFNGWSDYINCGNILDSIFCAPVAKFSVSGWANTRSPGSQSGGGGCIVTKSGGGDAGPYQWSITHYVGDVVYGAVFSEPTGTNQILEKSNGPAPLNQWFHFVYIFDGSLPESDRLRIYVNGSRANEQMVLHRGTISTTTTETPASLCIGSTMNLPALPGNFYNGTVDNVRIYNRALNSAEIQALYHERDHEPVSSSDFILRSFTPTRNALQISPSTAISAMFSVAINASTLTNNTVYINGSISGRHQGSFSYNAETKTVRIAPKTPFRVGEVVSVTLTRGIMSTAGETLSRNYGWSFTARTNAQSGSFQQISSANVGNNPFMAAAADIDGDGYVDLISANNYSDDLSILKNKGDGTFLLSSTLYAGHYPSDVVAADFNGDGNIDLAVATGQSNSVVIFINNGTGTFTKGQTINLGSAPWGLAVVDVDGDGAMDLAVNLTSLNTVAILKNSGTGVFTQASTVTVGSSPRFVLAADLNNDGAMDLAVLNFGSKSVSILRNNGAGQFAQTSTVAVGSDPWFMTAADLNNDGVIDLAVSNSGSNTISVLKNDGSGAFSIGSTLDGGVCPVGIAAIDIDGDGKLDLVVGSATVGVITLQRNNGGGAWSTGAPITVAGVARAIIGVDVDNDGSLELAVTDNRTNTMDICKSRPQEASFRNVGLAGVGSSGVVTVAPLPNALHIAPVTIIAATFSADINASSVNNSTACVNGSLSGKHQCAFGYGAVTRTLIITPKTPFKVGEVVTVTLTRGIMNAAGSPILRSYSWSFTVKTNNGSGLFQQATSIQMGDGSSPHSVTALDVDGNGTLDLVVANYGLGTVAILKNNNAGSFTQTSTVTVGTNPNTVVSADVNGDGSPDLVTTNNGAGNISILKNNGTGSFTSTIVPVGDHPISVAAADLNGDGSIDLAVANNYSNSVSILKNDGRGGFTVSSTVKVGAYPTSVAAGDFNNDGFIDLAVTNSQSNSVSILMNNGDGIFSEPRSVRVGSLSWCIAAADLNGDGYLDLAVTNNLSGTISILLNDGSANFTSGSTLNASGTPSVVTAVDVNGDGFIDLAVGDNTRNTVSFWMNNGKGAFTVGSVVNVDSYPCSAIAADFNGDGKVELATANGIGNSVSILSSIGQAVVNQNSPRTTRDSGSLEVRIEFTSPAGYHILYPGDVGSLKLLIRNIGQKIAKNVKARIAVFPSTKDIEFDRMILIGDIGVNSTVTSGCSVTALQNVGTRSFMLAVQIVADEGIVISPKEFAITTQVRDLADKTSPEIRLTKPAWTPEDPSRGMKNTAEGRVIRTRAVSIAVEGTARDANGIAVVRINDSEVPLKTIGQTAEFSDMVSLSPGDNQIEIVAIDNLRNQASMKFTVRREGAPAAGQNYALLFAVSNYDYWPHLVNPVPDAQAMTQELKRSYGFKTELVQNVTRDDILTTLRRYARMQFGEGDQLFIFFAGHGQFDPVLGDGYLVAKDSRLNDDIKTSYVAHSVLRTIVNNIPCRHIFLVVDACFGGTFDPLIAANSRGDDMYGEVTKTEFIQRKMQFKTRRFLTSGGKEYVPDGRPGQHSPFVRKFLEALRSYGGRDGVLTINEILQYEEKVNPQPRAGEFGANEPGSDFIFVAH